MKLSEAGIISNTERDFFWHEVRKNCSIYVSALEANKVALYRGMKNVDKVFGKKTIRTDRQSLMAINHSKWVPIANALYNQIVYNQTGIKDFRSKVAYCAVDLASDEYGDPYAIFPSNGTRYFIVPDTMDSAADRSDMFTFFWDYLNAHQREFLKTAQALTSSVFDYQVKQNLANYFAKNPEVQNKLFTQFLQQDTSFKEWRQHNFLFREIQAKEIANYGNNEEIALYGTVPYYYYSLQQIPPEDTLPEALLDKLGDAG